MPRITTDDYCFASYYLSEKCNFDCSYCFIRHPHGLKGILRRTRKTLKPLHRSSPRHDLFEELDGVIRNFLQTGKRMTLGFTGGEPLVYPRFVDICRRIIAHDELKIAIDSNLSANVTQFIDAVPPRKVEYVFASMHIVERERTCGNIHSFVDSVVTLLNKGYSTEVNYVLYPPLFDRLEKDYRYCTERGVRLTLKKFVGMYENKLYPAAYTKEQREIVAGYTGGRDQLEARSRHFNGRECNAGRSLIRIKGNGDVVRCPGDHSLLGNVFSGFRLHETARPCQMQVCPCFDENRLFNGVEAGPAAPVRMPLPTRARHIRNKLKGFWEQD